MEYFNNDPKIPVAARDLTALSRKVGRVETIRGVRNHNAVVVDPGDHRRQVWAKVSYRYYREAWERVHLYFPGSAYQVDHIYNRARAEAISFDYVRLFLCIGSVNQNHGSFLEKRLTEVARRNGQTALRDDVLFATNWMIAKLAQLVIDRESPGYDQQAALSWLWTQGFI